MFQTKTMSLLLQICHHCTLPWLQPGIKNVTHCRVHLSLCLNKYHVMKVRSLLYYTPRHKNVWASRGTAPRIHNPGTRWRWAVSFTIWPLYSHGMVVWYQLERELGGLLSHSGSGSEKEIRKSNPRRPSRNLVTVLTKLHWLRPITEWSSLWSVALYTRPSKSVDIFCQITDTSSHEFMAESGNLIFM
jgi:hypothetical protein